MTIPKLGFTLLALLLMLSSSRPSYAAPPSQQTDTVQVIVALRMPDAQITDATELKVEIADTQDAVMQSVPAAEIEEIHRYENLPAFVAEVSPEGLAALQTNPQVEAVDVDMPVQMTATGENGTLMQAPQVRSQFGLTGKGVNVAVLDTGLDTSHPDLMGSIITQHCFNHATCPPSQSDEGLSAQDEQGHGTHVAGIITSDGTTAPLGVAPDAGIVAVRVLNSSGSGWTSDVVKGLEWVVANRAAYNIKVVSMSLGGGKYDGICDNINANTILYANAIKAARQAGLVIFAASGNDGLPNQLMAPACVTGVIAVGNVHDKAVAQYNWPSCTDTNVSPNMVTCSSNSGSELDLLAPGTTIISTKLGGGQVSLSGTSMSTPHASAVAALMLQAKPTLSATEIETILKETGYAVTDKRNSRITPRVDALAAINRVFNANNNGISGKIVLQGRTNHSGAQIFVSDQPCATATFSQAIAITDATGQFTLGSTPTIASTTNYQCLRVTATHYLPGQYAMPQGNLGTLTLLTGDINGDNLINILDLAAVASAYGSTQATADLNVDNIVDIFDLSLAAKNYQKTGPLTNWQPTN